MITATLQNITKENEAVSFMVNYSNGEIRNYRFPIDTFILSQLTSEVKKDILRFESLDSKFIPIKSYLGKTYQLVDNALVEVK